MSSCANPRPRAPKDRGKRTLQRLRREAGYRCAKDFADELGIPNSTYSRYERAPESPDCRIPMQAAWAMADKLGVSIDLVVGRADIDEPSKPSLDERVAALSVMDREVVMAFIDFVEQRAAKQAAALSATRKAAI